MRGSSLTRGNAMKLVINRNRKELDKWLLGVVVNSGDDKQNVPVGT